MTRPVDIRDCSRAVLEAQADSLRRQIVSSPSPALEQLLLEVEAAIPSAPAYSIEYHRR